MKFLYVPALQGTHVAPSTEFMYPALQVHDVDRELPSAETFVAGHNKQTLDEVAATAVEYVSVLHGVQAAEPVALFHVPATHGVHMLPSGPVYPARHVQDVSKSLPADEEVFNGHAVQIVAASVLYVPAVQLIQKL
jgi:hypothetical protein